MIRVNYLVQNTIDWVFLPRSLILHFFFIAKCFKFDAFLVLGVFLPRFTKYFFLNKPGYAAILFSI